MMRFLIQIILLLLGVCLWIIYIFQEEMARYGRLYIDISYPIPEGCIPLLCMTATIIWLCYLLKRLVRQKGVLPDVLFAVVLIGALFWQGDYLEQQTHTNSTTLLIAEVVSVSEQERDIVVRAIDGTEITLDCPQLVKRMLAKGGQKYSITYEWQDGNPYEGVLCAIQRQGYDLDMDDRSVSGDLYPGK